jgi:hypothetical protein
VRISRTTRSTPLIAKLTYTGIAVPRCCDI